MVNIIDFLPTILNDSLFDGTQLGLAKLILCAGIIFCTAIPLLYLKATLFQFLGLEVIILIILTGLGWMDVAITVIVVIALALSLAVKTTDIFIGNKD
jgi:hypothetical protein